MYFGFPYASGYVLPMEHLIGEAVVSSYRVLPAHTFGTNKSFLAQNGSLFAEAVTYYVPGNS